MHAQLIRTATKRLDTLHASTYFSPLMSTAYEEIGLERAAQYFAARACALGPASSELVAATFMSFHPQLIANSVPSCWDAAAPERVHAARLRGVRALMESLLSSLPDEDQAALRAAAVRLCGALAPVVDAQSLSGRALYAAHRAALDEVYTNPRDHDEFLNLWVTVTLLREYRGDGHVAALVSHGCSGLDALILDCATGSSWRPSAARRSRGWSEETWRGAASKLVASGLLSDASDGATLTDTGREYKALIEAATDRSVETAWSSIDEDTLAQVRVDAKIVAEAVAKAELIPAKLFGRDEA